MDVVGGRVVPRVYRVYGRADIHDFLLQSIQESGGRIRYVTESGQVPVFAVVEAPSGQVMDVMIYPFRMTQVGTIGRPQDEIRGQIRYGADTTWHVDDHYVAFDPARSYATLLLGVHLENRLLFGLDPHLYDPLPLGISVYAKLEHAESALERRWAVWERTNRTGLRRAPRTGEGLETMVCFTPERLLDYAAFELAAADLSLDQALRYGAVGDFLESGSDLVHGHGAHPLEAALGLSKHDILELISDRRRLAVAVRGGVAEWHLERHLRGEHEVKEVKPLDEDGQPDAAVTLLDGSALTVECKNVSPNKYSNGDIKVEVQKTRATQGDPAGRLYRASDFDVVAACLYSVTGNWEFKFVHVGALEQHDRHEGRLRALHRVDARWSDSLAEAWARRHPAVS